MNNARLHIQPWHLFDAIASSIREMRAARAREPFSLRNGPSYYTTEYWIMHQNAVHSCENMPGSTAIPTIPADAFRLSVPRAIRGRKADQLQFSVNRKMASK